MTAFSAADWLQYLATFAFVIALLLGLLWALRKLQTGQAFSRRDQRLQVLESLSLGPRQKIALVRVDQGTVLLGITAGQITSLGPWPAPGHTGQAGATVSDHRAAFALAKAPAAQDAAGGERP